MCIIPYACSVFQREIQEKIVCLEICFLDNVFFVCMLLFLSECRFIFKPAPGHSAQWIPNIVPRNMKIRWKRSQGTIMEPPVTIPTYSRGFNLGWEGLALPILTDHGGASC